MLASQLTKNVEIAQGFADNLQTGNAIKLLEDVIKHKVSTSEITEDIVKAKEAATYKLATILKTKGLIDELIEL